MSIIKNLTYSLLARGWMPRAALSLAQNLADRWYLKTLLDQLSVDCVLDVGAHTGGYAGVLRRLGYRGRIISFEPTPESFAEMKRRFARDPMWSGFNIAVGSRESEGTLHLDRLSNLNSLLPPIALEPRGDIVVPVRRLDALVGAVEPKPQRIFLKTDTQGFDLEVIKGAAGVLDRVVGLQAEISVSPIYREMPDYLTALAHYQKLGFRLANLCIAGRRKQTLRVIEYDCLMYREEPVSTVAGA